VFCVVVIGTEREESSGFATSGRPTPSVNVSGPMGTEKRERQKAGRQARLAAAQAAEAKKKRTRTAVVIGGVVVLLVVATLAIGGLGSDDGDGDVATDGSTTSTVPGVTTTTGVPIPPEGASIDGETPCPADDGSAERTTTFAQAPPMCIDPDRTYTATFTTTAGVVEVELDTATTPIAANNFVVLSRYHYFDDTALFRTNSDIGIIQGGSPHTQNNSDPGPGYTIEDEGFEDDVVTGGGQGPFRYTAGDLVYARPGGQPDSSSAQFFFCATDACSGLDGQGIYVTFGTTVAGLDVLEAILASAPPGEGAPVPIPLVESITITES
jgi:cyclophilin family peptidyl-prolyl cis-trans isomerase